MKTILVTGSCGFIFSNFVLRYGGNKSDYRIISVDKIVSSYNLNNIDKNHVFYMGDVADEHFMSNVFQLEKPDIIVHGAAESFVDDSINSAKPFIHSNVVGTQNIVDLSLKHKISKFIYVSTDEVYGQLKANEPSWTESSITSPRNPYSASKLSGELIVKAAGETHNLNYNITRCCNNFGPRQPPRNLVPKIITSILENKAIPIHGNGKNFREWIYVLDHCSAIMTVLEKGANKEIYNVGSGVELTNLEMVDKIGQTLGVTPKINFIKDRLGHDFRYSVDFSKLQKLDWKPSPQAFDEDIKRTVKWYVSNSSFYNV
jgi:dTDP-glucose 4,6-dehydratase